MLGGCRLAIQTHTNQLFSPEVPHKTLNYTQPKIINTLYAHLSGDKK